MRLADFIDTRLSDILSDWERFAATLLPAAAGMGPLALRDHAVDILKAVAADLRTSQTDIEQHAKSWGERDAAYVKTPSTAAQVHGALRASSGFSIPQLVAEYRALRASVLRPYAAGVDPDEYTLDDIGRFNEALDQAIAESVNVFSQKLEDWRNLFLGILQHDLRGPLHAVLATSCLVAALPAGQEREQALVRLKRSGDRMKALLDELLDYNRVTLNLGLAIERVPCDLTPVCLDEVQLRRIAHPGHVIDWSAAGPADGMWDASRIRQALGNLIANAAKHGSPQGRIAVELRGEADEVLIVVSNQGPAIGPEAAAAIFDPLRRLPDAGTEDRTHLGLGLFIVRQIAQAHGGEVSVDSSAGSTHFCMRMPKTACS